MYVYMFLYVITCKALHTQRSDREIEIERERKIDRERER